MITVRLPTAYILAIPLKFGVVGVWLGSLAGTAVTLLLYIRLLRSVSLESIAAELRRDEPNEGCSSDAEADDLARSSLVSSSARGSESASSSSSDSAGTAAKGE